MKTLEELLQFYKKNMPKTVYLMKDNERYKKVSEAISVIIDFVRDTDTDAKIDINSDDLTGSSLCVEITASLVVIDIVDKFCNALRVADNFEICPKTDGNIGLNICFEKVFEPAPPKQ